MRNPVWLWACLCLLPSCGLLLDYDPPDPGPASDAGLADSDASFADAEMHHLDAAYDGDTGSSDAWPDGNVGDGSLETGTDSGPDSGMDDAGPIPGCGGELGLCLEVTEDSPTSYTASWGYNIVYTRPGGTVFGTDWTSLPCIGGIRTVAPGTTQCLLPIPPAGEPMVGVPVFYAYPVMNDGMPWCSSTTCPGFFRAYRIWIDGVFIPTDPSMGHTTLERCMGTPFGTLMCLHFIP